MHRDVLARRRARSQDLLAIGRVVPRRRTARLIQCHTATGRRARWPLDDGQVHGALLVGHRPMHVLLSLFHVLPVRRTPGLSRAQRPQNPAVGRTGGPIQRDVYGNGGREFRVDVGQGYAGTGVGVPNMAGLRHVNSFTVAEGAYLSINKVSPHKPREESLSTVITRVS